MPVEDKCWTGTQALVSLHGNAVEAGLLGIPFIEHASAVIFAGSLCSWFLS